MLLTLFIYLFFYKRWNLYVSYTNRSLRSKVLPFFHRVSLFYCNFRNNFTLALSFALFWWLAFLFCNLRSRSRRQRCWWTHFYHLASFHNLLLYQHFANKMYIFFLVFVAAKGNIKSYLAFHTVIVHPTEIF